MAPRFCALCASETAEVPAFEREIPGSSLSLVACDEYGTQLPHGGKRDDPGCMEQSLYECKRYVCEHVCMYAYSLVPKP